MSLSYIQGATAPDARITISEADGLTPDLSASTLELRVGNGPVRYFTKTAGLTVSGATITVVWASSGEIGDLTPGSYRCDLVATAAGKPRKFRGTLRILPAVA